MCRSHDVHHGVHDGVHDDICNDLAMDQASGGRTTTHTGGNRVDSGTPPWESCRHISMPGLTLASLASGTLDHRALVRAPGSRAAHVSAVVRALTP